MLTAFERKFGDPSHPAIGADDLESLRKEAGGHSFGGGLYRVLSGAGAEALGLEVYRAFPDHDKMISCFASDWLGRVFAIRKDIDQVLMFEPGTADVLNIGASLKAFHSQEILNFAEEALAKSFFEAWTKAGNAVPAPDQCVGYRKPLFHGGEDEIGNLELIDLDVYWTVSAPFIAKARQVLRGR